MNEPETVQIGQEEVVINPKDLEFNEANLNEYMEKEGALYNYYSQKLADAQAQLQLAKINHDKISAEKFRHYKQGISDKTAEAHTKSDAEVLVAAKQVVAASRIADKLKGYLRAWDKNHDNAQALGHMIRKEMDKLGFQIKQKLTNSDLMSDEEIQKYFGPDPSHAQ
jgi:hypothetical protein